MNKIFKVIWSHAQQQFVVASELSKAKKVQSSSSYSGSASGSKRRIVTFAVGKWSALSAATFSVLMVTNHAFAADSAQTTTSFCLAEVGNPCYSTAMLTDKLISGGQHVHIETNGSRVEVGASANIEGSGYGVAIGAEVTLKSGSDNVFMGLI